MQSGSDVSADRGDPGRDGPTETVGVSDGTSIGVSDGTSIGVNDGTGERWLLALATATVVLGLVSVVGAGVGTYALDALRPLSTESRTLLGTGAFAERPFHLATASVAVRIVRDLSIGAGGVAIVLGCWVAFVGTVRVAGRR
ncbi:hypothetical protein [Halorubrum sp. DTA98]|uniref:hypothetical protein n=1 Tax=Halorubrum sp. DTA98 TaxID=3402163 RepID=UPI003AADAD2E